MYNWRYGVAKSVTQGRGKCKWKGKEYGVGYSPFVATVIWAVAPTITSLFSALTKSVNKRENQLCHRNALNFLLDFNKKQQATTAWVPSPKPSKREWRKKDRNRWERKQNKKRRAGTPGWKRMDIGYATESPGHTCPLQNCLHNSENWDLEKRSKKLFNFLLSGYANNNVNVWFTDVINVRENIKKCLKNAFLVEPIFLTVCKQWMKKATLFH